MYEAPFGIRLSGSYQHYTGTPESTAVQVTRQTVDLTQVSQTIRVEEFGATRLPSNDIIDLRVAKLLRVGRAQLTPGMDMFNLTNASTIQSRSTQLGPTYGYVTGLLRPRMLRASVNISF